MIPETNEVITNRRKQMSSISVKELLAPLLNKREKLRHLGKKPKDHNKIYKQSLSLLKPDNSLPQVAVKLDKYPHIQSRVLSRSSIQQEKHTRDIVNMNKIIKPVLKPVPSIEKPIILGKIPTYLINRKLDQLKLQHQEIEKKTAPPVGMKQLNEEDRLKMLKKFEKERLELESMVHKFPVLIETNRAKRFVDDVEKRIKDVDESIQVFSKKVVFVKD